QAFKRAAVIRPILINPAPAPVERSARLRELRLGVWRSCFGKTQAKLSQLCLIISSLQFNIRENHAIAAQPTLQAEPVFRLRTRAQVRTRKLLEAERTRTFLS